MTSGSKRSGDHSWMMILGGRSFVIIVGIYSYINNIHLQQFPSDEMEHSLVSRIDADKRVSVGRSTDDEVDELTDFGFGISLVLPIDSHLNAVGEMDGEQKKCCT